MKQKYIPPMIEIEEFEIENILGNLCSGINGLDSTIPLSMFSDIID